MRNYDENSLALLIRTLPSAPEAWVKAAQEIPLAQRGLADIIERAQVDRVFRAALIADLESTLQEAGYDNDRTLTEAVRERLFT